MGFYTVLNAVNQLLTARQWQLHRCHRHGTETLHYFVTDANQRVLTPTYYRQRVGLTLTELLNWLEQSGDSILIDKARALKNEIEQAA